MDDLTFDRVTIVHECSDKTKELCSKAEIARIKAINALEALEILASSIKKNVNDLREAAWENAVEEFPPLGNVQDASQLSYELGQIYIPKATEDDPAKTISNIMQQLGKSGLGVISGESQEEVFAKLKEVLSEAGVPESLDDEDNTKMN